VDKVLDDWRTADISPKLKAALGLLETLVKTETVSADDVAAVLAAGVSRAQVVRAVQVAAAFTMIVRLADTFEFAIQSDEGFLSDAKMLLKRGYVM